MLAAIVRLCGLAAAVTFTIVTTAYVTNKGFYALDDELARRRQLNNS